MTDFRCRYCGDTFNLSAEDQKLWDEGYFDREPECCEECYDRRAESFEDYLFSDADSGL